MRSVSPAIFGVVAVALVLTACGSAGQAAVTQTSSRFLVTVVPARYQGPQRSEIVDSRGRLVRLVAGNGADAVLSPNRKLIAWNGKGGINVENVDGSAHRVLVKVPCPGRTKGSITIEVCGGLGAWASDSRQLLVQEPNGGLAVVALATGAARQIVAPEKHVTYEPVGWSVARKTIAFVLDDAGGPNEIGCCKEELVLARPSGSSQRVVYDAAEAIHDGPAPSWSPDGKWIAFTTDGRDPGDPRLAVVNVASGSMTRIGNFEGFTSSPAWAPDSSRFAVGAYGGPVELYSPSGAREGAVGPIGAVQIAWVHDGIYFWSGRTEDPHRLLLIPAGQKNGHVVLTLPGGQILISVQPI